MRAVLSTIEQGAESQRAVIMLSGSKSPIYTVTLWARETLSTNALALTALWKRNSGRPLDFWFAPEPGWEAELPAFEDADVIECSSDPGEVSMTDGDDEIHALLMQISAHPTAHRTVVAYGADLRGVPMIQVYEWDAHAREALEIAQDDSAEPRRRELCRQIGIAYVGNICAGSRRHGMRPCPMGRGGLMRELTNMQAACVTEFVRTADGPKAAVAVGFPEASASQRAHELRQNPWVQEAIQKEMRRAFTYLAANSPRSGPDDAAGPQDPRIRAGGPHQERMRSRRPCGAQWGRGRLERRSSAASAEPC